MARTVRSDGQYGPGIVSRHDAGTRPLQRAQGPGSVVLAMHLVVRVGDRMSVPCWPCDDQW